MSLDLTDLEQVYAKLTSITLETLTTNFSGGGVTKQQIANMYTQMVPSLLEQSVQYELGYKRTESEVRRVDAETLRVQSEVKRTDAEVLKVNSEIEAINAEVVRTNKDTLRIEADTDRVNLDLDRLNQEILRIKAEIPQIEANIRRTDAETSKVAVESDRLSADTLRTEADTVRLTNQANKLLTDLSLVEEQITLTKQKVNTEKAQTEGTVDTLQGILGLQARVYHNQGTAYAQDAKLKDVKGLRDIWSVGKTTDSSGYHATDTNKLADKYIGDAADRVVQGYTQFKD